MCACLGGGSADLFRVRHRTIEVELKRTGRAVAGRTVRFTVADRHLFPARSAECDKIGVPARLPAIATRWELAAGDRVLSGSVEDVNRALSAWGAGRSRNASTGEIDHVTADVNLAWWQDLLDVLPGDLLAKTEVVAGPVTGGALLAHTLAGLLDGRRSLTHPPCSFAPFNVNKETGLKTFYADLLRGKRVLLADDVRNTGKTFEQCADLVARAGGAVLATVEICDRMEAVVDIGVPNYSLAEYRAAENFAAAECPMCRAGEAITSF